MSSEKTSMGLHKWVGTDAPKREEFNENFGLVESHLNDIPNQTYITEKAKQVDLSAANATIANNYSTLDAKINSQASGSPKNTFATLAALQADTNANTTDGKKSIYVVTADGKWYYWNGSAWTTGGTYQSVGIAKGSIGDNEAVYPLVRTVQSPNLFNKNTIVGSKYIAYNDGTVGTPGVNPSDYTASDYIKIKPSTQYIIKHQNQMAFYDTNKVYISGIGNGGANPFTTPVNAEYMRVTTLSVNLATQEINEGIVLLGETANPKFNGDDLVRGSVKNKSIADLSIEPQKLLGYTKGKNIFNKNDIVSDKYVDYTTGNLMDNALYFVSNYIEIEPNTEYTRPFKNQMAFYDANKVYISGLGNVAPLNFTTLSNAKFIRVTDQLTNLDTYQLEKGSVPTEYESYGSYYIQNLKLQSNDSNAKVDPLLTPEEIFSNLLQKAGTKRIKLIGDSITHGMGGTGYAENGALISNTSYKTSPNSHSWANSFRDLVLKISPDIEVINWGISGQNTTYYKNNIASFIEDADDLVIMQLGTNDRHTTSTYQDLIANLLNIIDFVKSKNINVIVMSANPVGLTNDNDPIRNYGMFEVNLACKEAANQRSMTHISNYDAFMRYEENTGSSLDTLLADGLHPNDSGYDVMFRNIIRRLGLSYIRAGITI